MCVILPFKEVRVSCFKIMIGPLLAEVSVDCESVKNGLCCVEHRIDPDPTSISVTSLKKSPAVTGLEHRGCLVRPPGG